MELAMSLTPKKKAIRTAKKCVLVGGMILFLFSGIYSTWKKQIVVIVLAALIATIALVFGFWRAPSMLFNTLRIPQPSRAFTIRQVIPMDLEIPEQDVENTNNNRDGKCVARKYYRELVARVYNKMQRNKASRRYNVKFPAEKLNLIIDFSRNLITSLLVLFFSLSGFVASYFLPMKAGRVFFGCLCLTIVAISRVQFLLLWFVKQSQTKSS